MLELVRICAQDGKLREALNQIEDIIYIYIIIYIYVYIYIYIWEPSVKAGHKFMN